MKQPQALSEILTSSARSTDGDISEDELQLKVSRYLERWFYVKREVWSTDHENRIDLVIIHKTDVEKKYPIGIEIKLTGKKTGKGLALWLKQASKYTEKRFNGYGRCMIITCPQISNWYLREGDKMTNHDVDEMEAQNNVGTFIGQFGIGELQKIGEKRMQIVFKGLIIWESQYGELRIENYKRFFK